LTPPSPTPPPISILLNFATINNMTIEFASVTGASLKAEATSTSLDATAVGGGGSQFSGFPSGGNTESATVASLENSEVTVTFDVNCNDGNAFSFIVRDGPSQDITFQAPIQTISGFILGSVKIDIDGTAINLAGNEIV